MGSDATRSGGPQVWGVPGEGARSMGVLRSGWPLLLVALVAGYLLGSVGPLGAPYPLLGAMLLGCAGVLAWLVPHCEARWARHRKGAHGEAAVARELERLPTDWVVAHGWPLPGGDIDHVVLSPDGIFVVETRNWSGPVDWRDGAWWAGDYRIGRSPIDQVESRARTFTDALPTGVPVRPVICLAGATLPPGRVVEWTGGCVTDLREVAAKLQEVSDAAEVLPVEVVRELSEWIEREMQRVT